MPSGFDRPWGSIRALVAAPTTIAELIIRHTVPAAVLWLPVLLVPQLLFTLGVCWFLAALGVYMRDLGQIMTLILTLWFFITPICYSESTNLSPAISAVTSRYTWSEFAVGSCSTPKPIASRALNRDAVV